MDNKKTGKGTQPQKKTVTTPTTPKVGLNKKGTEKGDASSKVSGSTSTSNLQKPAVSKPTSTIAASPKVETSKAGSKISGSSPTNKPIQSSSSKNLNLTNKSGVDSKVASGNTTGRDKVKSGTSSTIKSGTTVGSSRQLAKPGPKK